MSEVKTQKIYRSPNLDDKIFTKHWNLLISMVTSKENFKKAHLDHLAILCRLYSDLAKLDEIILKEGFTYETTGRYGFSVNVRPECQLKSKCLQEIRAYSKILSLTISKEENLPDDDGDMWK